jgi:prophage antirepressor-like protein
LSTPSAIEALECTEEFTHANFGVSSYKDGSGKSIEALDCSEDFRLLNFQESSYKNLQNKQQHKDVLKAIRNLECSEEFRTLEQVIETFGDDHVITLAIVDALGRPQEATFITEAAGIFVVSRGRSELSKSLNRWLFGEVVPSIKKHKPSEERTEDMNTTTIGSAASLAVTNYDFSGNQIRTIVDDNGEPWFVAKDVTDVLGFRMASDATRLLDDDEKGKQIVRTRGGDQEVTLVNEPGLYSLILKSRKPEAKAFKKWVTSEVLPSIRKHKPSEERNEDMNELSIQTRTDIILRAIDKDANGQRGEASQIRVSSLDVARNFGKQHKDVLKAIRNLECSEEFRERNFALVEIIEKNAIGGQVNKSGSSG